MKTTQTTFLRMIVGIWLLLGPTASEAAPIVGPLLQTTWGQDGVWQQSTPLKDGNPTFPGCTTIATAQILYFYQYLDRPLKPVSYVLDHEVYGEDIEDWTLSLDLTQFQYDWSGFAESEEDDPTRVKATAEFLYHVGVSLNAQFGGGEGASATGKQIENAFRYQWGFNHKSRRSMSIISKNAFGLNHTEWADLIREELDEGRPVLYLAQQKGEPAGHAFVVDGYRDDGSFHINWGWGGYGNGYYQLRGLTDPEGRQWTREPMMYRGLEPTE